jgi:Xaa-Pro aminopeptidase
MITKKEYIQRRQTLVERIKQKHDKAGAVVLWGGFEVDGRKFVQESSFLYLTGCTQPGCALTIDMDGSSTLWVPVYESPLMNSNSLVTWSQQVSIPVLQSMTGIEDIKLLGDAVKGSSFSSFFDQAMVKELVIVVKNLVETKKNIYTLGQDFILDRLLLMVPGATQVRVDIVALLASLRRTKSHDELTMLFKAMELTILAHQGVACALDDGISERVLSAGMSYMYAESGADDAFSPIVAAGKNSCILHYMAGASKAESRSIMLVDTGARYNHYCADVTRVYPVSGTFSKRQREVYKIVADALNYLEELIKPGMYLFNADKKQESLHHRMLEFFAKASVEKMVAHRVGHYLGLDVHDLGNPSDPLQEGDVLAIEPALYLPEEGFGIRLEDDFWVIKNGCQCLSEGLPRAIEDIEEMAQLDFDMEGECGESCQEEDCQDCQH